MFSGIVQFNTSTPLTKYDVCLAGEGVILETRYFRTNSEPTKLLAHPKTKNLGGEGASKNSCHKVLF